MAKPRSPSPCLLVVAAFSRHDQALAWARDRLETMFGPLGIVSLPYRFHHTQYYQASMGADLRKQLLGFQRLVSPDHLADSKLQTNALEEELALSREFSELRPVNLDAGILNLGKFMLASVKDQAHRLYLNAGIFAEVTLFFRDGQFEPWPWTYADYREPFVRAALGDFRVYFQRQLQQ